MPQYGIPPIVPVHCSGNQPRPRMRPVCGNPHHVREMPHPACPHLRVFPEKSRLRHLRGWHRDCSYTGRWDGPETVRQAKGSQASRWDLGKPNTGLTTTGGERPVGPNLERMASLASTHNPPRVTAGDFISARAGSPGSNSFLSTFLTIVYATGNVRLR